MASKARREGAAIETRRRGPVWEERGPVWEERGSATLQAGARRGVAVWSPFGPVRGIGASAPLRAGAREGRAPPFRAFSYIAPQKLEMCSNYTGIP